MSIFVTFLKISAIETNLIVFASWLKVGKKPVTTKTSLRKSETKTSFSKHLLSLNEVGKSIEKLEKVLLRF